MAVTVTTTHSIEGRKISQYCGVVSGDAVMGVNIFKDMLSAVTDVVGGRSKTMEAELERGKDEAVHEMMNRAAAAGADAVVGVDLDYNTVGPRSLLMVSANGTAVKTVSAD